MTQDTSPNKWSVTKVKPGLVKWEITPLDPQWAEDMQRALESMKVAMLKALGIPHRILFANCDCQSCRDKVFAEYERMIREEDGVTMGIYDINLAKDEWSRRLATMRAEAKRRDEERAVSVRVEVDID